MPNVSDMWKMMKQAQKVKKIQKELARKTVEVKSTDGTVVVVAGADMTLRTITVDPQWLDPARKPKFEKLLVSTVNSALDSSKKAAAADMQKLTQGLDLGGLGDLFG